MNEQDTAQLDFATRACRVGTAMTQEQEHSDPMFLTSSFCFNSAAEAAARFSGEEDGNVYSRFTNPTVRAFENRLAALEGAEACIGTSSGMGAILSTCLALLSAGDHVVASHSIFGTTVNLFKNTLTKFGIEFSFVDLTDVDAWSQAMQKNTKMLFLETPSNPLTEVGDLESLAKLAHSNGALLVVDNCFCTPALQLPLNFGADIIIHSATKFLDGQGRCVGGAVLGNEKIIKDKLFPFLRSAGPTMSPFNAWVFLKGLETLEIRMQRHSESALEVAAWLDAQKQVNRVFYPGLESHPQHELARKQQSGWGGVLSFEIAGGRERAWELVDKLKHFSITANLGDSRSIVTHPASTTHSRISAEERALVGVSEGLLRLSIGLEAPKDLIADLASTGCFSE
ncbi:MAG: O-succinylhomoserine sulfhydrylase [Gammaproteobacteria bacterium]